MDNPSEIDLLASAVHYCRIITGMPDLGVQFAYVNMHAKYSNILITEEVDEEAPILWLFKYDKKEFEDRPSQENVRKLEKALGSKATWWELRWWMD